MAIKKYDFVPELNYWINKVVKGSSCEQKFTKDPVPVLESDWRCEESILELLFNVSAELDTYGFFYRVVYVGKISDREMIRRIPLYATKLILYSCEPENVLPINIPDIRIGESEDIIDDRPAVVTTGEGNLYDVNDTTAYNIFHIAKGEKEMLDILLLYKQGLPTKIDDVVYNNLPSGLSKLIYIFIIGEMTNDYSLFDQETPISDQTKLLEIIYEKWLLDHVFTKYASSSMVPTQENFINSLPQYISRGFTLDEITNKQYKFPSDKTPITEDCIDLSYDGEIQINKVDFAYELIEGPTELMLGLLNWDGLGLQQKAVVGGKFYLSWSYAEAE